MKKITRLFFLLALFLTFETVTYNVWAAQQYCQTPITATDGVSSVRLSCQLISAGNYQIKIESDVEINLSAGCYCNINGVGGNQLISLSGYVRSSDGKTITIDIPSSSAPNLYTPLYVLMPGEKNFAWPSDITWGVCSSGSTDAVAPTMGTASVVGTPTYNSANLHLTATDEVTNPVVAFLANDATNNVVNKLITADASGNGTITGLNPATSYSLTITARDAAYNVSANSVNVSFTTAVRPSECTGDKGHFGNPTVMKIHYTIQYVGGNVVYTITPYDAARTIDFAEVQTTAGNNSMTIASDGKSATYTKTGLTAGASLGVLFMYSLDNLPGNEMTAQTSALTDANAIYYKVGDCSVTDSEAPTSFTATKGQVTSTSVELLLNATDNNSVIVYTVSYGSTPTIVSQNGTSSVEKSFVVTGLTPNTAYTFSVEAKDAADNVAANNPLSVQATTTGGLSSAAPTPDKSSDKVISIYSDAYTPVGSLNLNPGWGQSTVQSEVQIEGNNTLKYESLNYQGITFSHIYPVSSGMTHLHIDVWTEDETVFQLYPICWTGSANEAEKYKALSPLNIGVWNSFNISLSDFTTQGLTMGDVYQFKVVGSGNTSGVSKKTVYIDNLYFYNDTSTGSALVSYSDDVYCYPVVVKDQLTVNAKSEIKQIVIQNLLGQVVKVNTVKAAETKIDCSNLSSGNYILTISFDGGNKTTRKFIKQ